MMKRHSLTTGSTGAREADFLWFHQCRSRARSSQPLGAGSAVLARLITSIGIKIRPHKKGDSMDKGYISKLTGQGKRLNVTGDPFICKAVGEDTANG